MSVGALHSPFERDLQRSSSNFVWEGRVSALRPAQLNWTVTMRGVTGACTCVNLSRKLNSLVRLDLGVCVDGQCPSRRAGSGQVTAAHLEAQVPVSPWQREHTLHSLPLLTAHLAAVALTRSRRVMETFRLLPTFESCELDCIDVNSGALEVSHCWDYL